MEPAMDPAARRALTRDTQMAAAMFVLAVLGLVVTYDALEAQDKLADVPQNTTSIALLGILLAPLAVRRLRPAAVVVFVTVLFGLIRILDVPEGTMSSVALFLAIYTAGAWIEDHRVRAWSRGFAIAFSTGVLLWSILTKGEFVNVDVALATIFSVAINAAFFIAAWMLGDLARTRRENERELAHRADQLAAEREERARRAVVDERVRIARELHDVVAHHVSVMGVQAGAARRVLGTDPDRAATVLASIEESGRQAVGELHKLVSFLRSGDEVEHGRPQPRLDDLDRLFEQTRTAGVAVDLRVVGRPRPVPASVELSAYRIVQEALTNALKHAGPVPATVVLTYTQGSLDVEVVNRRGSVDSDPGGGRGLVGMRERAAMVGGTFQSGTTTDGGYRVSASLPTGTAFDEQVGR